MGVRGVYREIVAPERLVHTDTASMTCTMTSPLPNG